MISSDVPTAADRTLRSVGELRGVGPERAKQLGRLGVFTIDDLLLHRPRRYEDRRQFQRICDLRLDEAATTRGTVSEMGIKRFRHGTRSVFELVLDDGSGRLRCRWWNLPFMEKYFSRGDEVVVFGKVNGLRPRTMDHPETEVTEPGEEQFIHFNRVTPVYPLTEGLPQRWLRALIWRTLHEMFGPAESGSEKPPRLPFELLKMPREDAIYRMHFPETIESAEAARRRLALEEFIELQIRIRQRRKNFESLATALPCGGDNRLIKPFLAGLNFKLTDSQTSVLREIRSDLRGRYPMRRLLQGDVGSGKTVVAACAALMTIESGYTVALMAPTEILAEQHFLNFQNWFGPRDLRVELRTGSRRTGASAGPGPELVIGTHALLGASLPDLGLVIIDEQHKFGVAQRENLVRKGRYPHLLVMTATPIPRTLGLTVYGDLDLSTIRTAPPGRGRIKTVVRTSEALPKVWEFVKERMREGRQIYVVCPRVEDSGTSGMKSVTREFESLQKIMAPFRVGLLHGRLAAREKERVMTEFRVNAAQVLLATALVEVGVDVPNASVMIIENAERFGLAQLHQLRGRIGRGAHESYCVLVSAAKDFEARERLRVLEENNDGFAIAEADLKLRGPGELLGRQQSGLPSLKFGDLATDWDLIHFARQSKGGEK